jgi:spore maturation protein SpmA/spore maturation protein SpmB
MNIVFFCLVLLSFLFAGWRGILWSPEMGGTDPMAALTKAMIDSASGAVELAIGLIGVMTLFLGLMKIAEAGGMLTLLSRLIRPIMIRLFPDVPSDHPAMGAMILNISANILGLGNAATPFGIRAMQELETLNRHRGTATDAMALFLAINTSSVTVMPTGVIALRAAAGSTNPAGIVSTTLFASVCGTAVAILAAMLLRRFFPPPKETSSFEIQHSVEEKATGEALPPLEDLSAGGSPIWVSLIAIGGLAALIPCMVLYGKSISSWILPVLMMGFLLFGIFRKVRIYEVFVEGAKEGFQVAVKIIPYLVAILVAVGMLKASGAMEVCVNSLGSWTSKIGLPAEALPMALMRSLSGSGAYGILASIIHDPAIGPDSYTGYLVSTLQGSSETTFYVLAVYFGAIQVRRVRHTLLAALIADVAAIAFSVIACRFLIG